MGSREYASPSKALKTSPRKRSAKPTDYIKSGRRRLKRTPVSLRVLNDPIPALSAKDSMKLRWMLSSKMNIEVTSNLAEEIQRQRLLSPKSTLFIIAPPL